MAYDVFISYSHQDTEAMGQVRDFLRENGLEVWTDEGIEPGTASWKQAIENALLSTSAVVVLFSPGSSDSKWVRSELDFAELHNVRIFSLLVRGDEADSVPFGYATHQWIDFRNAKERPAALERLLAVLQGKPVPAPAHHPKPKVTPKPFNWQVLAAIAFVIVLVLIALWIVVPVLAPSEPTATPTLTPSEVPTNTPEPTATARASAGIPEGWDLGNIGDLYFARPVNWVNIDIQTFINMTLSMQNEETKVMLGELEKVDEIQFFGDWTLLGGLVIAVETSDKTLTTDELEAYINSRYNLEDLETFTYSYGRQSLAQFEMVTIDFNFPINDANDINATLYLLAHDSRIYYLMFMAVNDNFEEIQSKVDTVLESIQFGDSGLPTSAATELPIIIPDGWQLVETEHLRYLAPSGWIGGNYQTFRGLLSGVPIFSDDDLAGMDAIFADISETHLNVDWIDFRMVMSFTEGYGISLPIEGLKNRYLALFAEADFTIDEILTVSLPQGEALRFDYEFADTGTSGYRIRHYVISHDLQNHSLILGASNRTLAETEPIFEAALASLQFVGEDNIEDMVLSVEDSTDEP